MTARSSKTKTTALSNKVFKFNLHRTALTLGSVALLIAGCSLNPVSVTRQPISVKKQYLEDIANKKDIPLKSDETALTTWKFGCQIDFEFDILEKTQFQDHDFMVTIKIRKVHFVLTAPITVWISKNATAEVAQHEEAHVRICKLIYDKADKTALKSAEEVVGKTYQASGKTVEDACQSAIERASEEVSERYHSITSGGIDRMSAIFDELDAKQHEDVAVMLEKALEKYRLEEEHLIK